LPDESFLFFRRNDLTELLYQTDSYLKEFTATVIATEGNAVVLDRTAFYPGGGGQPADKGTLTPAAGDDSRAVVGFERRDGRLWHKLDGEAWAVGAAVVGRLDWEQRYQLMRTHTALHILCGMIFRHYGASVTGGNMEPLKGRMDFELEHMSANFAEEVEAKINAEVAAARPVVVRILPREEAFQIPDLIRTKINLLPPEIQQVRVVEIVGLDLQADGGTHVANTSEVGHIRVVSHESKGKINKRLRIALD
jgi:misacylated tRNA(Ala) deacylase